jgi:hypothetical protein
MDLPQLLQGALDLASRLSWIDAIQWLPVIHWLITLRK